VDDVIVMRFQRKSTERLIDQNLALARLLRDTTLRDLANAHGRTLLLGRMTAPERVAAFLLEMFERRDRTKALDLPMSRNDIADYLGLTIETVCRTLSAFKRDRIIAIPNPHRIELIDRDALEAVGRPDGFGRRLIQVSAHYANSGSHRGLSERGCHAPPLGAFTA
jgi:CRP-like cAMP-binding protein